MLTQVSETTPAVTKAGYSARTAYTQGQKRLATDVEAQKAIAEAQCERFVEGEDYVPVRADQKNEFRTSGKKAGLG